MSLALASGASIRPPAGIKEDVSMKSKTLALALALVGAATLAEPAVAQNEQFLPSLVYRTGPYAPNGIPFADGVADYWTLLNEAGLTMAPLEQG